MPGVFQDLALLNRLETEGDVAAVMAAVPRIQKRAATIGHLIVLIGRELEGLAVDCDPIVVMAAKIKAG